MRKILIPTDFSDNANNALEFALELFKYEISEVFIMHAYQDEIYADDSLLTNETLDEVTRIVSKRSKKQLETTLTQIEEKFPNPRHTYKTVSTNNILIDAADTLVDQENIDSIVMGTKGKTNNRKLTFGSHTLQVLKYVQCPVLAIPQNYKYTQPKHILFPTNFYVPFKRRELKLLNYLATPYRAVIDMLYISKSKNLTLRQKDNKDFLAEVLRDATINFNTVDNKSIINAIHTYIKENTIDMLVMVNTRHSFLENILFQSAIDELSLYIDIPFLALQNIKRY